MRRPAEIAVATGLAGWVAVTFVGQHPNPVFDNLRRTLDPYSTWIPNWRFFAPNPANMDFQLLVRFSIDDEVSDWQQVRPIPERRLGQAVWFPARRIDKGLFDVIGRFFKAVDEVPFHYTELSDYITLRNHLSVHVTAVGGDAVDSFQFAIVRDAGYDPSVDVEPLFISRNEKVVVPLID